MIGNPQAIRFCNEQVRPIAERVRALKAEIDAMMATWHGGLGAVFVAGQGETIDDGREAEGVSRLTGNDVLLLASQLEAIQTQLNGGGVAAVISKPCVRPLRVQGTE